MLYITKRAAVEAAKKLLLAGKAAKVKFELAREKNADRSFDQGFKLALFDSRDVFQGYALA